MIISNLIKDLELKINLLRISMVSTAQLKGLNHPDTIKQSQELDQLLNEYQQENLLLEKKTFSKFP